MLKSPANRVFSLLRRALRASDMPRFVEFKTVSSALLDRSVKCRIFEAEAAG